MRTFRTAAIEVYLATLTLHQYTKKVLAAHCTNIGIHKTSQTGRFHIPY